MGAPASGQPGEGGSCTNVQPPAKQLLVQLGTPYVGDPGIVRAVRGTGAWTEPGETLIDRRKRNGGRRT